MTFSRVKIGLLTILASLMSIAFMAAPVAAHHCFGHSGGGGATGQSKISECLDAGACLDTKGANCANKDTLDGSVNNLISTVISFISYIVGIVSVIMIIIGGLKYITSSGDSNNVTSAKNTILYAIIGLVVVAFAQIIVRFVLNKAT